jgi:acylphosphatase
MISRRLRIIGRVQGVGYRDALCRQAGRLGVTGWVRNRSDGSVEALVQGEAASVDALIGWATRGPPAAQVTEVSVEPIAAEAFGQFERKPTV